jgi:hypothetical protein
MVRYDATMFIPAQLRNSICAAACTLLLGMTTLDLGQATGADIHKRDKPADEAELAGITSRGRAIADYDQVAWHATDAVLALPGANDKIGMYIGRQTAKGWVVAFGKLNEKKDAFLLAFETEPTGDVLKPHVIVHTPIIEDRGEWLNEARAFEVARSVKPHTSRQYNGTVLQLGDKSWYVYFYPAQTTFETYPVGGDMRYLVSNDGLTILETRHLHATEVVELGMKLPGGDHPALTAHDKALYDSPEDTDVANVLMMGGIPMVVAGEKFVYTISADGKAEFAGLNDASNSGFKKEVGRLAKP